MELRPYQKEAIAETRKSIISGNRRVILMLPTGGGKTLVAKTIIKSALEKGKKVLFICDRKTLIGQSSNAFSDIPHGIIQSDNPRYQPWHDLQVATVQSLMRRGQVDADLVIVDECHTQWGYITELMNKFNLVPFIGLTATPFSRGLGKAYEDVINPVTTAELIDMGYLIKPVIYAPPTIDVKGLRVQGKDFNQKQVSERVKPKSVTADIVRTWLEKGDNRKTILFPCNVHHSKELVNEFNLAGVPSEHIDAHTPDDDRIDIFKRLKEGDLQILSSVGVLTTGFDETSVNCIILARPTKSLILYVQMVGRGLRSHDRQEDCIILDHAGNVERLGWPDDDLPTDLCNGDKTESQRQEENEKKKDKELKPKKCPDCHYLVEAKIFICPSCGHHFSRPSDVDVNAGELEKLDRIPPAVKAQWYSELLHYARGKGYSDGWASHKFKEKFKHWPKKKSNVVPCPASPEVLGFIQHLNIKYSKRKAK